MRPRDKTPSTTTRLLAGAVAGAAATAALDATTYLDMAVRGRPARTTPQQMVQRITAGLGVEVPGDPVTRHNRLAGLGGLSGIATGVFLGVLHGALDAVHVRPPAAVDVPLIAGATMLLTNGTMAAYGVTDPRTWSRADWMSDVVPHLVFGAVLYATYRAVTRP